MTVWMSLAWTEVPAMMMMRTMHAYAPAIMEAKIVKVNSLDYLVINPKSNSSTNIFSLLMNNFEMSYRSKIIFPKHQW